MSENVTHKIPVHQSLVQPVLVAGAERELTILMGFLAAIIWVAGKDLISIGLALLTWFIGNGLSRMAAKEDPQRIKVFFRHIKYRDFYPATEKINAPIPEGKTHKV